MNTPITSKEVQDRIHNSLLQEYCNLLHSFDFKNLETEMPLDKRLLSNIFLPDVSDNYLPDQPKIMIVGQETRHWLGKLSNENIIGNEQLKLYVERSMSTHKRSSIRPPKKFVFLSFMKKIRLIFSNSSISEKHDAIIWSNLFALDYAGQSPKKHPNIDKITDLSMALLKCQIKIFQPDAILFATGPSYDHFLKNYFEISDNQYTPHKIPRKMWPFQIEEIPCFRVTHPRYRAGHNARLIAINLIREYIEDKYTT